MATILSELQRLAVLGFKAELRPGPSDEQPIRLMLESPDGVRNLGYGRNIQTALVNALVGQILSLGDYLRAAESDRDLYKRGLVRMDDRPLRPEQFEGGTGI